ncbi:siderophore-interacting protein [Stigmatella aurantiaca]|uniref:FAD-binding 9, siderophore-interacting domain protein n=1 Tax=Stigmatella aurantiaca (strain DW4/3-1) TaxID=378806 RepID=E3FCN7_STIAD|nr:siderophore-interacting protein [Stigmatella aurantiaca]ADO72535.1 FAD-binding 9, siderophore-interacting domain protein [Stigmatella aurantiaca DW4/3-1]
MASVKAIIGSALGRFVFHDASVVGIRDVAPRFRRVDLEGPALQGIRWEAGDKVQVFLPETGMRTYTPLSWDAQKGATAFLIYLHGEAPGAVWGRTLQQGTRVQFFGPRRSVSLGDSSAPLLFFGDETSFGVAHALKQAHAQRDLTCVFEVTRRADCAEALREFGFEDSDVERSAGDAHLAEVHERLKGVLQARKEARLVLTGKAQSIQALRARLRSEGLPSPTQVKAYWSVGKTGLD